MLLPALVVQFATLPEEVPKQAKQRKTHRNTPKHHETQQNYIKLNFRLFCFLFIQLINFFFFLINYQKKETQNRNRVLISFTVFYGVLLSFH